MRLDRSSKRVRAIQRLIRIWPVASLLRILARSRRPRARIRDSAARSGDGPTPTTLRHPIADVHLTHLRFSGPPPEPTAPPPAAASLDAVSLTAAQPNAAR